ncbi:MAG: hypothetical protein M3280_03155 [Actinomycetota bacterium]|nr:hypothetical protein [Actinomycetota bacterium]
MTQAIEWTGFILGIALVVWNGSSVLRSLIVPRGLSSKLSQVVATMVRKAFLMVVNRSTSYETKDRVLALLAPVFLMTILFTWISLFLLGFALILWPFLDSFGRALLESGSSTFTLGFAATNAFGPSVIHFLAAGTGLAVVALLIAYLPTIYAAFNRREIAVTTLQSRAGAPAWGPEILARHHTVNLMGNLASFYNEWEHWAADVAESHTNYPVLIWLRSPHPLRNWVIALLSVLDSAALYLALSPQAAPTEARLCMRMGFTCLRTIADFLRIPYDPDPLPTDPVQLSYEEFHGGVHRLEQIDFPMERSPEEAWSHFRGWRVNYESVAYALADLVVAPPGPWSGERHHLPGMTIVPQRPVDRSPEDPMLESPKKERSAWHA